MNARQRQAMFERLRALNPHPTTELEYSTPFELLVAVILSAQATDKSVNLATRRLFPVANTPRAILDLGVEGLSGYVRSIGLYQGKARNINAESVEMNITINLDCALAPGDGKKIDPPPPPTAASLAASSSSSIPAAPVVAPRAPQQELTPPDEPAPPPDGGAKPGISPEQIEARRERLKRLREERENRRRQLLDNPAARGSNVRDRFQKTMPSLRGDTDDAGDE